MGGERAGDGGGRETWRVANVLRERMLNGTYSLHGNLPTQRELAEEFTVSRDTVQRALRELVSEGWIETRQGSGSWVIKTQEIHPDATTWTGSGRMTLRRLISRAFDQPEVLLDVFTLSSESLDPHIRLQLERIRTGEIAPRRISLRLLLPSESVVLPYPRTKDDPGDPRPGRRLTEITRRYTESLLETMNALRAERIVPHAALEIRHTPLTPAFKLYLLNGVEALHGPYKVEERPIILAGGEEIQAIDVVGLGSPLTHFVKNDVPESAGSFFVDSQQAWFDSVWDLLTDEVGRRPAAPSEDGGSGRD